MVPWKRWRAGQEGGQSPGDERQSLVDDAKPERQQCVKGPILFGQDLNAVPNGNARDLAAVHRDGRSGRDTNAFWYLANVLFDWMRKEW